MKSLTPEKQKPSHWLGSLNMVPGLGIILKINLLFIIVFVGKTIKPRPHESPHKKSFCFCDDCHDRSVFQ